MRTYTNTTFGIACAVLIAGLLYYVMQAALIAAAMEPDRYEEIRDKRTDLLQMQKPVKFANPEEYLVYALMDQERVEITKGAK